MKTQIRHNVFETNSSSMHSLVVKKKDEYYTTEEVQSSVYVNNGEIMLIDNCFGRSPFTILTTFIDKVFYAIASMCQYKYDDTYNEICKIVTSLLPDFVDFDTKLNSQVFIKDYTSKAGMEEMFGKDNFISKGENWIAWYEDLGEVEEDILTNFLKDNNVTLEEFLKNKKYIVIIDGDEYCIYQDMKKVNLINTDDIEFEYPNYDEESE